MTKLYGDCEERQGRFPWVIALIAMPVLYLLSAGPVAWAFVEFNVDHNGHAAGAFGAFYAPLGWLMNVTGPHGMLAEYIQWWVELAM